MSGERTNTDTAPSGRMAARPSPGTTRAASFRSDSTEAAGAKADAPAGAPTAANTRNQSTGPGISTEPSVDAATPAAEEVRMGTGVSDQEFGLAVDVIYHRARAAWFASLHRVFLFGTIMAGSAAATDIVNAKECAFLAAALGTLDLVLDPTSRMVDHRDIGRDTLAIVADLNRHNFSEDACRRATNEEFRLSASELAPFNALRTMAFNQAITAFGEPAEHRVWVPWERRWLANLCRFEGRPDANRDRMSWAPRWFQRRKRPTPI